jgi:hypothetical protein
MNKEFVFTTRSEDGKQRLYHGLVEEKYINEGEDVD